jgi:hypothetical protein
VRQPRAALALAAASHCVAAAASAQDAGSLAAEVAAPPAAFSGISTLILEWRGDNRNADPSDDGFYDALWRTSLQLDGGDTRVSMRIDGEGFAGAPPEPERRDQLRLERVALELDRALGTTRLGATLGDFYAQLGHGLVLSLRRIDEIGLDVALRGARADLALFDDRLMLTALAGVTNPVNIEVQRLRHTEDARDPLAGARIEARLGAVVAGLHAAAVREARADPAGTRRANASYGGSLEANFGSAAATLEIDGQQRTVAGSARLSGLAAYATATVQVGRLTLLLEGKHYDDFEPMLGSTPSYGEGRFAYSQPPTAELVDQELIDNTNVTGGRVQGDVAIGLGSGSTVQGSLGLFRNRLARQWFAHGFGGIDLRGSGGQAVRAAVGYRRDWEIEGGRLARSILRAEIDVVVPLAAEFGLHAIGRQETHAEPFGLATTRFQRGNASLEFDIGHRWVLAGGFDWNSQDQRPEVARAFGYGLVRLRATDDLSLQLLAGSQRGGIRCIAGACRDQPAFAGVRLDATARF